jgi:hypothetical protein
LTGERRVRGLGLGIQDQYPTWAALATFVGRAFILPRLQLIMLDRLKCQHMWKTSLYRMKYSDSTD